MNVGYYIDRVDCGMQLIDWVSPAEALPCLTLDACGRAIFDPKPVAKLSGYSKQARLAHEPPLPGTVRSGVWSSESFAEFVTSSMKWLPDETRDAVAKCYPQGQLRRSVAVWAPAKPLAVTVDKALYVAGRLDRDGVTADERAHVAGLLAQLGVFEIPVGDTFLPDYYEIEGSVAISGMQNLRVRRSGWMTEGARPLRKTLLEAA